MAGHGHFGGALGSSTPSAAELKAKKLACIIHDSTHLYRGLQRPSPRGPTFVRLSLKPATGVVLSGDIDGCLSCREILGAYFGEVSVSSLAHLLQKNLCEGHREKAQQRDRSAQRLTFGVCCQNTLSFIYYSHKKDLASRACVMRVTPDATYSCGWIMVPCPAGIAAAHRQAFN